MRIVKLVPPKISYSTISEKISCDRPFRKKNFNISIENNDTKTIVHCYGHGGSGWTLLFHSVKRAIDLLQQTCPDPKRPIRVIGAGCMGLAAAIELQQLGYTVAGIYAKERYDIPSWNAAGLFSLNTFDLAPEEAGLLRQIIIDTFLTYRRIERGQHPSISADAVRLLPYYCKAGVNSGIEALEENDVIPKKERVTLDFGNGVIHKDYWKYSTYFMNTSMIMQQFMNQVQLLKIPVEIKTINAFHDIEESVIFNCAGLGARVFNQDRQLIPVRGFLMTLNQAAGSGHMDYLLTTMVQQEGKEEEIYLIPKNRSVSASCPAGLACVGALGGTFIHLPRPLTVAEEMELANHEFKRLLERAAQFFQG